MGSRLGIGGFQNSGKSFGRRYIPDGERCMILQPSIKFSHLYTGPKGVEKFTPLQIDEAIKAGKRKPVGTFDLEQPGKYKNLKELMDVARGKTNVGVMIEEVDLIRKMTVDKKEGSIKPEHVKGNSILCKNITYLGDYLEFINKHLPWIHTVFLPDFTHFISEVITSLDFRNKVSGGDQYKKYLDLAAEALRNFITSIDGMRRDLVVVTEFHVEYKETEGFYELFVPGGKMVKEKLLPSSYYDVFLFTEVTYKDDSEEPIHQFVTDKTRKYPEARSMGIFGQKRIPNDMQTVLTQFREAQNIPIPELSTVI